MIKRTTPSGYCKKPRTPTPPLRRIAAVSDTQSGTSLGAAAIVPRRRGKTADADSRSPAPLGHECYFLHREKGGDVKTRRELLLAALISGSRALALAIPEKTQALEVTYYFLPS